MSGCWVKVSHNGTLQRFLVSSDEINNITWKEFEQRLKESHHIDEPIIATHISKFGEYVQFDSDAELQELLHSVPHDSRSALRIFVKTFSQVDKAGVEDGDVGSSGDDKFASGINGANTSGSGGGWDGQHPQTDSFRSQLSFTTDAHTASSKSISTTMSGHLPSARVLGTDGWRVEVGGSSPAAGSGSGGQHSMSSFSSRSRLSQNSIVSQTGFSSFSSDVEALSKRVDNLALAGKDSLESWTEHFQSGVCSAKDPRGVEIDAEICARATGASRDGIHRYRAQPAATWLALGRRGKGGGSADEYRDREH
ncbi:hypothetical protein HK096_003524 [Nowakowskiella sp. JEL0078]|nr:hypothetical protein HK096_003524 [Nowakowskiella sp. JEL0078]